MYVQYLEYFLLCWYFSLSIVYFAFGMAKSWKNSHVRIFQSSCSVECRRIQYSCHIFSQYIWSSQDTKIYLFPFLRFISVCFSQIIFEIQCFIKYGSFSSTFHKLNYLQWITRYVDYGFCKNELSYFVVFVLSFNDSKKCKLQKIRKVQKDDNNLPFVWV